MPFGISSAPEVFQKKNDIIVAVRDEITTPLRNLIKKDVLWIWSRENT